jgi:hypothetical protein
MFIVVLHVMSKCASVLADLPAETTALVIPGRAQREPGIHNHERKLEGDIVASLLRHIGLGVWIPGPSLRDAPE